MITDKQRKNQIIRRIQNISPEKIKKLQEYVDKLEENIPGKERILSYAGTWRSIDNDVFQDLTENLISNRQKNKRRFED